MPAKQIYSMVNTMANNISYTGQTVVDTSTFVAFAQNALSSPNLTESVYSQMYDLIGKTVIAIDEAEDDGRGIVVDSFEYGAILQKFSFELQQAETSSEWDIANPENPYAEVRKTGIIQKFFENYIPTFSWKDVSYTTQLKEAFKSPESLAGFTDALYIRMRNAYKIAKTALADAAIGALMANIYSTETGATPTANAARRVRHLLTEYNTAFGTTLTKATAMMNTNFLEFVRKQILIDKKNLNKMTKLYNDSSVERRTPEENIHLDLSLGLTTSYDKFFADAFGPDYVKLPKHNEVVNWGIATSPDEVKADWDGSGTPVDIANILGFMYDKDAVVATMDRSRFVSMYDQWNDRNVFKLTANRRYIADPSENGIIYLCD